MAKITYFAAAPDFTWLNNFLENDGPADIDSSSSTELKFTSNDGFKVTIAGSGFGLSDGIATTGTIKSITIRDNTGATKFAEITGLSESFQHVYYVLFGFENPDGDKNPEPWSAIRFLTRGNDQIVGSNGKEDLGGYSAGNDIIDGKGGDDNIHGDPGNDKLIGGGGNAFDELNYDQTFWSPDLVAFRGIVLDTAAGTATDPWGGHDTFSGFEGYRGSGFADVMKGSNAEYEEFKPLRGKDTIDGRGSFDRVDYSNDINYGGKKAIIAHLDTGKIKDGWGETDTVKNVEGVRGTAENDQFFGSDGDNSFQGLDGVDSYDGGKGFDYLDFSANDFNDGLNGAVVNLGLGSNQVVNDGYGNSETAVAMEALVGSSFADTFTGNNKANRLIGRGDLDNLNGRGGNDTLEGDEGSDRFIFDLAPHNTKNHDIIADFEHGVDDIRLSKAIFGLTGNALDNLAQAEFRASNNGSANSGTQKILYNTSTGDLFFDADGNGNASAKVLIAHLDGKPTLDHFDIELIA